MYSVESGKLNGFSNNVTFFSDNVTFTFTLPHCHSQRPPSSATCLLSQGSGVQFGVVQTTGGYAGSFCTGVGKLPCCACAAPTLKSSASAVQHKSAARDILETPSAHTVSRNLLMFCELTLECCS